MTQVGPTPRLAGARSRQEFWHTGLPQYIVFLRPSVVIVGDLDAFIEDEQMTVSIPIPPPLTSYKGKVLLIASQLKVQPLVFFTGDLIHYPCQGMLQGSLRDSVVEY